MAESQEGKDVINITESDEGKDTNNPIAESKEAKDVINIAESDDGKDTNNINPNAESKEGKDVSNIAESDDGRETNNMPESSEDKNTSKKPKSSKHKDTDMPSAPNIVVVSQKTYHKNSFINEFLGDGEHVNLHSTAQQATVHTGEGETRIYNMPGMYDTDTKDVDSVKEHICDYLVDEGKVFTALIMLFVHPIRWTGEEQDFIHTIEKTFRFKILENSTLIVIADYKTHDDIPFEDYVDGIIENYSTNKDKTKKKGKDIKPPKNEKDIKSPKKEKDIKPPKKGKDIKLLGDLYQLITKGRIFSAEQISESREEKQRFLACASNLKTYRVIKPKECFCVGMNQNKVQDKKNKATEDKKKDKKKDKQVTTSIEESYEL